MNTIFSKNAREACEIVEVGFLGHFIYLNSMNEDNFEGHFLGVTKCNPDRASPFCTLL